MKELFFESTKKADSAPPYKGQILFYLRCGAPLACAPMSYRDRETGQKMIEAYVLTDGAYFWTSDIIYHFEKYNYLLPDEFVAHVLKHQAKTHLTCPGDT